MRNPRDNTVYIHHIHDSVEKIASYLTSNKKGDFEKNEWDQDAVARNLEIIGEAANNLDDTFKKSHPDIPWRKIIAFRNIIAHDYADLDPEIIWEIITDYLPKLSAKIDKILE